MSEEQKPVALNIYGVLDNELGRMHQLMLTYLALTQYPAQPYHSNHGSSHSPADMSEFYKRITKMQDMLMGVAAKHDELIQQKVAELALTGDTDEA